MVQPFTIIDQITIERYHSPKRQALIQWQGLPLEDAICEVLHELLDLHRNL